MLTLAEMAARLGVPAKTVKTWHHAGLITGHPYNDKASASTRRPAEPASPRTGTQAQRTTHRPPHTTREPAGLSDPTATVPTSTTTERSAST